MNLNLTELPSAVCRRLSGDPLDGAGRGAMLNAGLILIYAVVVTPLAVLQKLRGRARMAKRPSGWRPIEQSTMDTGEYEKLL